MENIRRFRRQFPLIFSGVAAIYDLLLRLHPRGQKLRREAADNPPAGYRMATPADATALAALVDEGNSAEDLLHFHPHDLSAKGFAQELKRHSTVALVGRESPIRCYAFVRLTAQTAWIGYLVHRNERGKKKGKKIARALADLCRNSGYRVCATIHKSNSTSLRLASPYLLLDDLGNRIEIELLPARGDSDVLL